MGKKKFGERLVCGEKNVLFSIGWAVSFLWKHYIYIHNLDLCLEIQVHISNYLQNSSYYVDEIEFPHFLSQNLLHFWNYVIQPNTWVPWGQTAAACPKLVPAGSRISSCSFPSHIHSLWQCVMNTTVRLSTCSSSLATLLLTPLWFSVVFLFKNTFSACYCSQ